MTAKYCPKCKQHRGLDEFHRDASRRDGRNIYCKECTRVKGSRTLSRLYKACSRCHETKPVSEFWRDGGHSDGLGAYCKGCTLEHQRELHKLDPEKAHERGRRYYQTHSERTAASGRKWRREHPEKRADYVHKRRALLQGADHKSYDVQEIYKRDRGICQICHEPIGDDSWHRDHLYPISRGGPDVYENVRIVHARCNLEKGDRMPNHEEAQEWMRVMASWA